MTILGWMHRKFRPNIAETHNDFSSGQPLLDDLQCHPRANYCNKPLEKLHTTKRSTNSFAGREATTLVREESSPTLTELFHGFLAIGTLGTESITSDPSTPTFSISVDHIAEKETEATENELKLINNELEKVLADESCNISLGRNSYVSARSSGQSSINIVISGKQLENGAINENVGGIVCPLQSYLFGSAIGSPEIAPPVKREQRTSLGDLFQKTNVAEENPNTSEEQNDKSAGNILKQMIKRKTLSHTSKSSSDDSRSAETKLRKILQMFHRKFHRESSTAKRTSHNPTKNTTKSNFTSHNGRRIPKESIGTFKSQFYQHQFTLNNEDAGGKGEHWVKTDADYLVLEL